MEKTADGKSIMQQRKILEDLGIDLYNLSVHHIDGDKKNNDLDNLYICSWEDHLKLHKGRKIVPVLSNVTTYLENTSGHGRK